MTHAADAVFVLLALVTLTGAVLAVSLKNVFYNALALILALFGVAGLFIYLNSEFLAIMEVIIYIGAIAIAIIFAIMLSSPMRKERLPENPAKVVRGLVIAVLFFLGLTQTLRHAQWHLVAADAGDDYSIAAIGKSLLSKNALPFEAVSFILLIAIIGALVISQTKETPRS